MTTVGIVADAKLKFVLTCFGKSDPRYQHQLIPLGIRWGLIQGAN